jgi:3-deoxy-manno-octulosonate cytidylyltransferase (CMP-KDO synthetase)
MSFTVLIPARMSSSRLPNKPLADLNGLPMVVRVAQQALKSKARQVIVAAEDQIIVDTCLRYNIQAIKTASTHVSGTDRLAEAARLLQLANAEIIVNVQGDEPFIEPELINSVAALLQDKLATDTEKATAAPAQSLVNCVQMGTAAHAISDPGDFFNPNVVKVVADKSGNALYFSRAPLPFPRDLMLMTDETIRSTRLTTLAEAGQLGLRHIGIYSYTNQFLQRFALWPATQYETSEALEQLRVLENGFPIGLHLTPSLPAPGIDTPADLERARALLSGRS